MARIYSGAIYTYLVSYTNTANLHLLVYIKPIFEFIF